MITIVDEVNQQAKIVLECCKLLLESNYQVDAELLLKHFDNCREQGYVLELQYLNGKYVIDNSDIIHFAFAECRNSDGIVVYQDLGRYQTAHNCSDNFWHSCHSFEYGQAMEAARYIIKELIEHINSITNRKVKV